MNEYSSGKLNEMCPKCNQDMWVELWVDGKCRCGNKYTWEEVYWTGECDGEYFESYIDIIWKNYGIWED